MCFEAIAVFSNGIAEVEEAINNENAVE